MITGYLIGSEQLIAKIDAMPARVKASLDETVQRIGFGLQQKVQEQYLRGPRPSHLGVVIGRLLDSITQGGADSRSRFESTATSAFAFVGTNVEYAAGWEFGFSKKVGAGSRGGLFWGMGEKALSTYFAKHPPSMKEVMARPFLVPALADMRELIVAQMQQALQKTAVEALK